MKKRYYPSHAELALWLRNHKIAGGADATALNAAVADLTSQVTASVGTEASAKTLIEGFAAIVTQKVQEALTADNAADQASIDAATQAIADAKAALLASSGDLAAAVAANSGN